MRYSGNAADYSAVIAPVGQAPSQAPQSMQASAFTTATPFSTATAPTGQAPSQAPQPTHASETLCAIIKSPFIPVPVVMYEEMCQARLYTCLLYTSQGRCGSSFAGPPGRGSGGAAGQPPCPGTGPAGSAYPAAGRSCHPAAGRTGEPEDRTHRICRKAGACIKKTKTNREPLRRLRYTGGVLCLGYCFGVRRNHVDVYKRQGVDDLGVVAHGGVELAQRGVVVGGQAALLFQLPLRSFKGVLPLFQLTGCLLYTSRCV